MTREELKLVLTAEHLTPLFPEYNLQQINATTISIMTPFLDVHNDAIGLYLTDLDGKLVLADEDAIPDMLDYTAEATKTKILAYVTKKFPKQYHEKPAGLAFHKGLQNSAYYFQQRGLVVYELNTTLEQQAFETELLFALHTFLALINEVIGVYKYLTQS